MKLNNLTIWPPVVLAPMAGITNAPFRRLCATFGAGLYVSEMVTTRMLVERPLEEQRIIHFDPSETIKSIQLYGVDPDIMAQAVHLVVDKLGVQHIDINFGCPVNKITRKGGGAALPLKTKLTEAIITKAVKAAGEVPVTVKTRLGINDSLLTYRTFAKIAEEAGVAAIGLHARTAEQFYGGDINLEAIAEVKQMVSVPVLGNGNIWQAQDALNMMEQTGCDGVIIGRGCLGRPWIFKELADAFEGRETTSHPSLNAVIDTVITHAAMLVEYMGETGAMLNIRKHLGWYLKGFESITPPQLSALMQVKTLPTLYTLLSECRADEPYPEHKITEVRAKSGKKQKISLPEGFLKDCDTMCAVDSEAEQDISGG